ncbi:MAG: TSCPD domain-containing protein [Planctomycetota bacterium]
MIEQLKGIRCLSTIAARKTDKDIDVLSCPDAIARALNDALQESSSSAAILSTNRCLDCGRPLRREEGCNICDGCGYSKCG